jgi:soluble lytic murein transglycosylase-like protein
MTRDPASGLLNSSGMEFLSIILTHLELAMRLHAAVPWLAPDAAYAHVEAASAAASDEVPAELLLGVAFVESRFDPTAVSRIEGGMRKTGSYPPTSAPARLDRRASLFCGPLQTYAASWPACLRMRDLDTAYAAGATELRQWLHDPRVGGSTVRALAGHGCGNHGVTTGRCNGYPERVLSMTRRFRAPPPPRGRPLHHAAPSS